jgi:hypothetical protein
MTGQKGRGAWYGNTRLRGALTAADGEPWCQSPA